MDTKEKQRPSFMNKLFISVSVVYLILGVLFILFPKMNLSYICYGISVALIALGVILIVKYFVTEAYVDLNDYSFAIGVFLVIGGLCTVIKNEAIANNVHVYIGVCILLTAVIKLQNSMALKSLNDRLWIVILVVVLMIALCAVFLIINPFDNEAFLVILTYASLLFDGIMSLFSYSYLAYRLKKNRKKNGVMTEDIDDSNYVTSLEQVDDSSVEE